MKINKLLLMYVAVTMIVVGLTAILYAGYKYNRRGTMLYPIPEVTVDTCSSFLIEKGLTVTAPVVAPTPEPATQSGEATESALPIE